MRERESESTMRFAAAVLIAGLLLVPSAGVTQEAAPAVVQAPQPLAGQAEALRCQGADAKICVVAISGATVAAVIAANAITGGALAPVLLAGNGGVTAASVIAGLFVAHIGVEIAMVGAGSAAAVVTGVTDPVIAAASDAYTTARSYVVAAADTVSTAASDAGTAVGNWLNGE
jgi:hypothetical protein